VRIKIGSQSSYPFGAARGRLKLLDGLGVRTTITAISALAAGLAVIALSRSLEADAAWYIKLAQGHLADVPKPFATRLLYPWLVRLVQNGMSVELGTAFVVTAACCLLVTVVVTARMLGRLPLIGILGIVASPFFFVLASNYHLPDILHAALLALFFLSLRGKRPWLSLLLLVPMALTREQTLVLGFCTAVLAFRASQFRFSIGVGAVTIVGFVTTVAIGRLTGPNIHQMPDLLYLLLKVPFNFSKNILGLQMWADTFDQSHICTPIATWPMPNGIHLGVIERIGICGYDLGLPLSTLIIALTTFGVAPTLLLILSKRGGTSYMKRLPQWIQIAIAYGAFCFITAPFVGSSVFRLIGYAWPAFWLAMPQLLPGVVNKPTRYISIFAINLATYLLALVPRDQIVIALGLVAALVILHWATARIFGQISFEPEEAREDKSDVSLAPARV
jgi:hypothetical protein